MMIGSVRTLHIPAWTFFLVLCFWQPGRTACGLNFCPKPQPGEGNDLRLGIQTNYSGFQLYGSSGSYVEIIPDLRYRWEGKWELGLHAPFVILSVQDARNAGFGNPMGFVERHFMPWTETHLGLGLQMEMPLWNSADGLADEHLMLVPYLSWSQSARNFSFGGNLGIGYAFTGEHHHSVGEDLGSPVYVNPHADRELLYRAWVGVNLWNRLVKPELFLDGQRVLLDHTEDGTGFLSAGMSLRLALGRIAVAPGFEIPVFSSRRKDWRFGIQGAVPM